MSKHHDPGTKLYEEVQARQRNTTWPDVTRNAGSVDALLWRGSPKATVVQRIGIAIFSVFFLFLGVGTAIWAVERHSTVQGLVAFFAIIVGLRIGVNAFVKQRARARNLHPHRIPPPSGEQ